MILLDTHIWLWLLHDPSQLSQAAQTAIESEESQNGLLVSAISVWEVAVKSSVGKLALPLPIDEWYELAETHSGMIIEPLSPIDAIASTQLPDDFHKDPADRILVAIARRYEIPLVTCDAKILNYPHVKTIW
ncbi:MAG: type II toxin-antitoxin system VapC family toxin [Microcystis sp. M54BS1]|jgi:PIN domain nuclease of toxin-antitoxin system|uniref:type II toxin-antitoxin system VapC family toxin n=1 Tax=unclassified Microcystis TaxID=2643300 RepID=UPI001D9CDCE3|nr:MULTISPECIES: type II toxin-antitoxin system VapC family toxin [unclassified Microcystis]MBE5229047.1 type II toxin-antitoxin system VapC family toxin [Microcystis aeruginosa PMC 728.11]MCA2542240.1 type II toxin-antitoxin system VapC family toxin [Microcystis sp. M54BS1]MCA2610215.1 type II toxin-antitoxin system VapC family toxin [Microcystis sp. M27BS1]MCA6575283.1 type II toxin-antitoxin system VapC family toxin [Pseudanabaena sp. M53BS1SP1A06MG]MCA6583109.1 type II toxin-antitoxin syst